MDLSVQDPCRPGGQQIKPLLFVTAVEHISGCVVAKRNVWRIIRSKSRFHSATRGKAEIHTASIGSANDGCD